MAIFIVLKKYGVQTGQKPEEMLRPPAGTSPLTSYADDYCIQTVDKEQLPDIEGFGWEATIEERGPADTLEYWRMKARQHWDTEHDHEDIPGKGSLLLNGAEAYLREYALTPLNFPDYYSRFENIENEYRWSADGLTHVSHRFLRRCVRLANGSGRIDTEQTHAVLCALGTIVISGPRGIFLVELPNCRVVRENDSLPDPPETVWDIIQGISLPEENPTLQTGFRRYIKTIARTPYPSPKEYHSFDLSHTLKLDNGERVTVSENALRKLAAHSESARDVRGHYDQYCNGETYTAEVEKDDLPGHVGKEVTIESSSQWGNSNSDAITGTVAGYRVTWREDDYIAPSSTGTNTLSLVGIVALVTPELTVVKRAIPIKTFDV